MSAPRCDVIAYSPEFAERFWRKVVPGPDCCMVWTGAQTRGGYGHVKAVGRMLRVHRVAYELRVGQIPDGLQLDHLCRNRLCVNPVHLEPVTNKVNALRGESFSAHNARQTHCIRGHDLSTHPNGVRYCKICHRLRTARRSAAGKDAPNG